MYMTYMYVYLAYLHVHLSSTYLQYNFTESKEMTTEYFRISGLRGA